MRCNCSPSFRSVKESPRLTTSFKLIIRPTVIKVVNVLNWSKMLKVVTFPWEGEGNFVYIKKLRKLKCLICEIFNKIFQLISKLSTMELEKRKLILNKFLENLTWSGSRIAKSLKMPRNTVNRLIKRYKQSNHWTSNSYQPEAGNQQPRIEDKGDAIPQNKSWTLWPRSSN